MKQYSVENIRNIAVIGHGGEGKTSLCEAMLFNAKLTERIGKVEDGTTVTDYDPEEVKRQISIGTSLAPYEWNQYKVNLIDVPGYFDFAGEMVQGLRLADSAIIVLGAQSGLTVGAQKALNACLESGKSFLYFINQMDREHADYNKVLAELGTKYRNMIIPITMPILEDEKIIGYIDLIHFKAMKISGDGYEEIEIPENLKADAQAHYETVVEAAAENDDNLIEKYFNGEQLSYQEIISGLHQGIANGRISPVFAGSATENKLVNVMMDMMLELLPSPLDMPDRAAVDVATQEEISIACDKDGPFIAQVIKTVADPFVGKLSIFRVLSGILKQGANIYNANTEKTERAGNLYTMRGKQQEETAEIIAGDIGALAKLQNTNTGDTLCHQNHPVIAAPLQFPEPSISMAVTAAKQGDEEKVFGGLARLVEEDPSFTIDRDPETLETLLRGQGEVHLEVITSKLKDKFGAEAKLETPKIAYRETIRKKVKAEGRHRKQTGGHGQFGHVWIEFEPIDEGFEFVDKIVGGVVPRQYIPAVEKGLEENLTRGVIAGYPLVGIRATLYDGSHHAVDSSEMAFKMAARIALRQGGVNANPVLLEPIYRYEILTPEEYMGDIIGDLNRRRGRIMGMNPQDQGMQEVVAEVPLAEMLKYGTDLRSMTQARGSFHSEHSRYEEVPANISQKIMAEAVIEEDEE